jgi:hypothetical protein
MGDSNGCVVYDAMLHRLQGNQDILTISVRCCFPHLPLMDLYGRMGHSALEQTLNLLSNRKSVTSLITEVY